MSNSFFDFPASGDRFVDFVPLTAGDLNDQFDLVSAGFDKLPTPAKVNGGYANYAAATGAANAYVVALSAQITALADGLTVRFKANAANTGAATVNVNSLGAKSIVRPGGAALEASDIANGQIVEVCYDSTNDRFQLQALVSGGAAPASTFSGTAGGTIDLLTGASIASAATINLNAATGNRVHITGTTPITAVTLTRGPRTVIFDGALTLTHHATTNNLPGGQNITTAAGDRAIYESDGTTVYCVAYQRASGHAIKIGRTREARTSNTILGTVDTGKTFEFTNSFTQTTDTAANLGDGWECILDNAANTGEIYLTVGGGATVDGATAFLIYPGEVRWLFCTGAEFHSVVLHPFSTSFTASGNFFKPPGYTYFGGLLWGAGASGGKGTTTGGGGGGACVPLMVSAASLAASAAVVIGGGGAAQTVANTSGSSGGNSTFAGVTAYGGAGGYGGGSVGGGGGGGGLLGAGTTTQGGLPLSNSGDDAHFGGGWGAIPTGGSRGKHSVYGGGGGAGYDGSYSPRASGKSVYGGGGGGAYGGVASTAGGTSAFGGAGGDGVTAGAGGIAGTVPAGGGGGTSTGTASGAGARGELRIWGIV